MMSSRKRWANDTISGGSADDYYLPAMTGATMLIFGGVWQLTAVRRRGRGLQFGGKARLVRVMASGIPVAGATPFTSVGKAVG